MGWYLPRKHVCVKFLNAITKSISPAASAVFLFAIAVTFVGVMRYNLLLSLCVAV